MGQSKANGGACTKNNESKAVTAMKASLTKTDAFFATAAELQRWAACAMQHIAEGSEKKVMEDGAAKGENSTEPTEEANLTGTLATLEETAENEKDINASLAEKRLAAPGASARTPEETTQASERGDGGRGLRKEA